MLESKTKEDLIEIIDILKNHRAKLSFSFGNIMGTLISNKSDEQKIKEIHNICLTVHQNMIEMDKEKL